MCCLFTHLSAWNLQMAMKKNKNSLSYVFQVFCPKKIFYSQSQIYQALAICPI